MIILRILLFILFLVITSPVLAQEEGWKADPDVIREQEENRKEYNWRESDIPEYVLPDLAKMLQSSEIYTPEDWKELRLEILGQFRNHMYGYRQGAPDKLAFEVIEEEPFAMDGLATLQRVGILSEHQGNSHRFEVILFLPNDSKEAVPLFLLMNNRDPENTDPTRQVKSGFWPAEEVIRRGYGIAAIQNSDLAPDDAEHFHEGVIRLFEGEDASGTRPPDAWGALAAWGWGASRVMDYFETTPFVDESKVAVLGHSRGGKAALWAGAEDERFSLVISNNSGSGGAALSRRRYGETIKAVNRFTHWFTGNFEAYNDRESQLPFDQHMLIALIAPRGVYVASANEDLWADPKGEFLSLSHASPVYSLWGHNPIGIDEMPPLNTPIISGPRGYHIRNGGHNLTPADWHYFMDFADHLWYDEEE